MPAPIEIKRLTEARPPVLDDTEAVVSADEEERILRDVLAAPRVAGGRALAGPRARVGGVGLAAAASLAVALVIGGALLLGTGGHAARAPGAASSTAPARPARPGGPASSVTGRHAATLRLASYSFKLPAGYRADGSGCATPPAGSRTDAITVLMGLSAAASEDGGCIEAELAAGSTVVPAGAEPVEVGSYQGYEVSSGSSATLYVVIPVAVGNHYLVLAATGLTPAQLVAVAASGLPSTGPAGSSAPCTAGCG